MSQQGPKEPEDLTRGPRGYRGRQGREGEPGPSSSDDELLEELKKVGSSLAFRQQIRRVLRFIAALAVIALLSSIVSIIAYVNVRDYQETACERDNDLRKAYTNQWEPVLAQSPKPVPPPEDATPEEVADYEAQVEQRATFEETLKGFAQHPC